MRPAARTRGLLGGERGMVTAFLIGMLLGLLALAGLALDGGEALAAKVQAINTAEQAARAGAQQIDLLAYRSTGTLRLQPAAARAAAASFLAAEHATGSVAVAGNTVSVTVTAVQHTQLLDLIGIDTLTVTGTAHAVPERGITAPQP